MKSLLEAIISRKLKEARNNALEESAQNFEKSSESTKRNFGQVLRSMKEP